MHIPDGMLSPSTAAISTMAMVPVWTLAARKVRATLGIRQVPMLSLGAAFCFTIMMFNIPALGGTTAHPVGGTLLAVMLGSWAAVIGISVALAIQALFFGDGGILTLGANCFTMAFALPFVGYTSYRLLVRILARTSHSPSVALNIRALAAGIGGYIAVNVAAALVALLLGIQPVLFHEQNGHAIYFPFGLSITLPAMLATHLIIAGPAEGVVTFLVVRYLLAQQLISTETGGLSDASPFSPLSAQKPARLLVGLLTLLALTPLGLLAKGEAWGEWDAQGVAEQIKHAQGEEYVPRGIAAAEEHGYKGIHGLEDYASHTPANATNHLGYIGAGVLGGGSISILLLLGGRLLLRSKDLADSSDTRDDLPSRDPDTSIGRASPSERDRSLPAWLTSSSPSEEPEEIRSVPEARGKRSNPFLTRTLEELAHNLRVTLEIQEEAHLPGYLQRLDPRAKVLGFLGLILLVSSQHRLPTLAMLYASALLLALASRLPILPLLRRVWLSVPLFVGTLILPATLNLVSPGPALLVLWHHPLVTITSTGLMLATTLLFRIAVAVTFAALLTLTTPWNDLLRALRIIHLPRLFVGVLAMTY